MKALEGGYRPEAALAVLWKRWPPLQPSRGRLLCVRARGKQGTWLEGDGESNLSGFLKSYELL